MVFRFACQGIGDNDLILGRIVFEGRKIQGVLSFGTGQFAVDVFQPEQISGLEQAFQAEIVGGMDVVGEEAQVPPFLPGQIGGQIAGTAGYANTIPRKRQ